MAARRVALGERFEQSRLLQVGAIVAVYLAVHDLFFHAAKLSERSYFKVVYLADLARAPVVAALLVLTAVLLAARMAPRWDDFEHGAKVRVFILLTAAIIAWKFSTYDYNLYYDQGHYVDRLVLLALWASIYFSPAFVPVFLCAVIAAASQFHYPIAVPYSWTDKRPVFEVLVIFSCVYFLRIGRLRVGTSAFLLVVLSMIGANYFYAAIAKISIGPMLYEWVSRNELFNLMVTAYNYGWLGFMEKPTIIHTANALNQLRIPVLVVVLAIQLGALFILWNRRLALLLFFGFEVLHIGIALASGIIFWKWVLLNLAVIWLLRSLDDPDRDRLFNRPNLAISAVLILVSPLVFKPVWLGWFDTRLNNIYRVSLVGESGTAYQVPRTFFSPYDIGFAQGRFVYLSHSRAPIGAYGATKNYDLAEAARTCGQRSALQALPPAARKGFDPRRVRAMREFLGTYLTNLNQRGTKETFLNAVGAPYHIYTFPRRLDPRPRYRFQEQVAGAVVTQEVTCFDGHDIRLLRRQPVLKVEVGP